MDLPKILFFVFKLAWKLLLAVGAVFLWLLSLLPDNDDDGDNDVSSMGVDFYGNIHEGPTSSFFTPELGQKD